MGGNSYGALLGIGIAAGMLFCGALVLFRRERSVSSFLQLIGAACLIVVVLTHVAEALRRDVSHGRYSIGRMHHCEPFVRGWLMRKRWFDLKRYCFD
jgi:hypothetical protein